MATAENEPIEGEIIDDGGDEGELVVATTSAVGLLNSSEIDMQIATAHKFPRSIKRFKAKAREMACLDEETAASMFYKLPRKDGGRTKMIEGPSVRLAEIAASSYGNLRFGARIIDEGDKFVTAQGMCHDLENNIAVQVEVKRRITNKYGQRYSDDMVGVTMNAACSIALRQAIFKIIPMAYIKPVYENAKLTSVGKLDSINSKRAKALEWFRKAGATDAQVLALLEVQGIDDISVDHLITLNGLMTAIKDGDTTLESALQIETANGSKVRKSELNDKIQTPRGATVHQDEATQDPAGGHGRLDRFRLAIRHQLLKSGPQGAKRLYDDKCGPTSDLTDDERAIVADEYEADCKRRGAAS